MNKTIIELYEAINEFTKELAYIEDAFERLDTRISYLEEHVQLNEYML